MPATALVQTRIDPALKERAVAVLDNMGLTVSDAVRILLTRIANEGRCRFPPTDPAAHDAWFRAKVQQALQRYRPAVPHVMTSRPISPSGAQPHFASAANGPCGSKWSAWAQADREAVFDYIEADNLRAAVAVDKRISDRVNSLARLPRSGRPGRVEGTRELVIIRTPYIVAYRIVGDTVHVLRVLHSSRQWPDDIPD